MLPHPLSQHPYFPLQSVYSVHGVKETSRSVAAITLAYTPQLHGIVSVEKVEQLVDN